MTLKQFILNACIQCGIHAANLEPMARTIFMHAYVEGDSIREAIDRAFYAGAFDPGFDNSLDEDGG